MVGIYGFFPLNIVGSPNYLTAGWDEKTKGWITINLCCGASLLYKIAMSCDNWHEISDDTTESTPNKLSIPYSYDDA